MAAFLLMVDDVIDVFSDELCADGAFGLSYRGQSAVSRVTRASALSTMVNFGHRPAENQSNDSDHRSSAERSDTVLNTELDSFNDFYRTYSVLTL